MEPRLSVSQITTFRSGFADDVRAYAAAGLAGIGIWELKLPAGGDGEALETLAQSGLARASAVPEVPSVLPLPLLGGPDDPAECLDAYCRSLERLAPFEPTAVVLLTGTGDRDAAVDGLRTVAAEAGRLGLTIALEPYQREGGELWSDDIAAYADRFAGVHICDWREPTRGWVDRALPGDGAAGVPAILRALDAAGWDGLYDIEIFSDDGTFGSSYDDSYWAAPAEETLARAQAAFERCWNLTPREVEEAR